MTSSLLLVGCGKMGSALLQRWQHTGAAGITHFDVIDPHHNQAHSSHVRWFDRLEALPQDTMPDVIVLAVKPQQLASVLPAYKSRFTTHAPLYLSIAAGKDLTFYRAQLGEHSHIVRAMPNTPALAGEGMTALCAAPTLSAALRHLAASLMEAVGKTLWLDAESQMDAVTAISGCGPAYVFLFLDALVKAGVKSGLPETMAKALAVQTLIGSGMLASQSHETLEQLRINVTSPNGATEAGLRPLMDDNALQELISAAVSAAATRSRELAS